MARKNTNEYVNNAKFYEAMLAYHNECEAAKAAGLEVPRIPKYVGECIYEICTRLAYRPNFINYSYRDEMISDGLESCISGIHHFDPIKYKHPFNYFTTCAWYAFLQRISKEKKQQYVKYKSLENAILSNDQHVFQDSDNRIISTTGYNEAAIHTISTFEDSMKKKKDIATKKKKALENFIEDDNV